MGTTYNQLPDAVNIQDTDLLAISRAPHTGNTSLKALPTYLTTYLNTKLQLASPNQITNLYGGGVQSPVTGAATNYPLTYPLAPRYIWTPNAGVTLVVTLLAYDATRCEPGQPLEFVNNGGANSAVQLFDKDGNFIANTSIGNGQRFVGRLGTNTVDVIRLGTVSSHDASEFEYIANKDANNGYAGLTVHDINFYDTTGANKSTLTNSNTASRSYKYQDRNALKILDDTDLTNVNNTIATITPGYASLSTAGNMALNNPGGGSFTAALLTDITLAGGTSVTMPSMITSPYAVGTAYVIKCLETSKAFSVFDNAGAQLYNKLSPGQFLILEIVSKSTAAGVFRVHAIGPSVTISLQTGTTYTLAASDNGTQITFNNAGAITVTVPVLFQGFNCGIKPIGAGQITFVGSGTTLQSANNTFKSRAQFSPCNIWQDSQSTTQVDGDLTQ